MLDKGLVQIYTGSGKGKTTAAFGLALRAAGHGANVLIYQFLKPASLKSGERAAVKAVKPITLKILDQPWDMRKSFDDAQAVQQMRERISGVCDELADAAKKKLYDVIILDEIVFCVSRDLAELKDVRRIIKERDPAVEIVMTGRGAGKELIALADLVTEMKPIKHPFDSGIKARKGIEY